MTRLDTIHGRPGPFPHRAPPSGLARAVHPRPPRPTPALDGAPAGLPRLGSAGRLAGQRPSAVRPGAGISMGVFKLSCSFPIFVDEAFKVASSGGLTSQI